MKIKNLLLALCVLSVASNYASKNDELAKTLALKEEELRILSQKISDQEQLIISMGKRTTDLGALIVEKRKRKMLSEEPEKKISEIELANIVDNEIRKFMKDFFTDRQIKLTSNFLNNSDTDLVLQKIMLQFHALRGSFEGLFLMKLLAKWEVLAQEVADLYSQIESSGSSII